MYNYPVTHEFQYICMYRESIYLLTKCTVYMFIERKYLCTNYYVQYICMYREIIYGLKLCTVYMYVQYICMYVQRKYLCTNYI